jgi:uncharacterized protein (DUF362 family)
MSNSQVALIRCVNYDHNLVLEALQKQFLLLGGLQKFVSPGDTVLIKPNFIAPKQRQLAVQTDPAVIIALAELLKDFGANPIVGDSPAWGSVASCIKALNMEDHLKKMSVPAVALNDRTICKISGRRVNISSLALETDVIINVPKFKAHQQLMATLAVKNMFGCVVGKQKPYWHFIKGKNEYKFCKFLIEIYQHLKPALTIIDAVVAMEGPGPIHGDPKPLGWLIAGADPISCEALCAKLINMSPDSLPIVQTAKKMGFGCPDLQAINILGDSFQDNICKDFVLPPQIPIKFSLLRVLKSICKQLLRRIKNPSA